ncbi:ergosterol biosynthesis protein [Orbilia brochopaga]|uniref:Ergosterol biosynthesis protein n=1 Tax=Orbilia brochopaga TaxID=3140254 RepID=A0AAV9UFD3_9PEZI
MDSVDDGTRWYNSLPAGPGLLPKFLLLVSVISIANSAQCYSTLKFTKRVYAGKPFEVSSLSSRTFGTWTLLAALVRFYAAYNISNPAVYDICVGTFVLAGWHFVSEWLYFGTAKLGEGLTGPLIAATTGLTWMLSQRAFYLTLPAP